MLRITTVLEDFILGINMFWSNYKLFGCFKATTCEKLVESQIGTKEGPKREIL